MCTCAKAHLVSLTMLRYVAGPCGRVAIKENTFLVEFRICPITATAYTHEGEDVTLHMVTGMDRSRLKYACRKHFCWALNTTWTYHVTLHPLHVCTVLSITLETVQTFRLEHTYLTRHSNTSTWSNCA